MCQILAQHLGEPFRCSVFVEFLSDTFGTRSYVTCAQVEKTGVGANVLNNSEATSEAGCDLQK